MPAIAIDLFSGAGGMALGARWAGVDVVMAVELDPWAYATYRHNHPDTFAIRGDISKILDIGLPKRSKPLILFGGPPCQGFSTSNQRTRTKDNEKNWLFQSFVDLAARLRPEFVVFENVKGILETEGGLFVDSLGDALRGAGYSVSYGVLDASQFGVPQRRNRFFMIGALPPYRPVLPEPLCEMPVSVDEAIADLPELPNGFLAECELPYRHAPHTEYARAMRGNLEECSNHLVTRNAMHIIDRYKLVPQGGNWEDIPEELMANYADRQRCHTGIYRRLRADTPAVVIGNFRKNMLIHPWQDRGLSVREAARLQSFPDWYGFKGSIGFRQQQVGNAVPPLLAKAVFARVLDELR